MATALAYLNYAGDACTVSASSQAGNMYPENVLNVHTAERWRGASGSEWLMADLGGAFPLNTIALMGCNLTPTGTVRIRVSFSDATGLAGDLYDSGNVSGQTIGDYGYLVRLL